MADMSPLLPDKPLLEITDPAQDRYARMRLVEGYDQGVIAAARVLVVGAGALGNEVLKNLALLGIGHIFVVDFDTIETHNLTRSVLFRMEDRGRAKVEVAAERVRQINPDIRVIPFRGDVIHDVGLGVFAQVDVVLGCLDNRASRQAVNRACWRVGKPWVDGALNVGDGSVRVFVPPASEGDHEAACYECLMTRRDYELAHIHYSCPPIASMEALSLTTPMSASIIGAMQVQEAVKLLHGEQRAGGWGVYYSGTTLRTTRVDYPRRADCPVHKRYPAVQTESLSVDDLTVGQVLALVADDLGPRAQIVLPGDVVTALYCAACDVSEEVYQPYRVVVPERVPCPQCGRERIYDVTSALALNAVTAGLTLRQVGLPAYAHVDVRAGRQRRTVELSADHARVLAGWSKE